MSLIMELNPFDFFTDTNGDALDSGYVWIGEPNKDPRQYPVLAYYDEALTIPAAMPLRTSNGYIVRNGAPTFLYINGNYSILVQDSKHRQIYYVADFFLAGASSAVSTGDLANSTDPAKGAGMVGYSFRTVAQRLDESPSIRDFWRTADGSNWKPAFDRATAAGKMNIWVPRGNYGISSTVFLPAGTWVDCESRDVTFIHNTGGSFTDGCLFMFNTTDGVTWTTPFPNMNTGGFRRCKFENQNGVIGAKGVKCFGSGKFEQIRFSDLAQSVIRPTGFYTDSFVLEDIIIENPQGNLSYQIDIIGLGDGFMAKNVHAPYTVATSQSIKAMRLRGINGGTVEACIGGDYLVEICGNLNIIGGHYERAQHIYDSSNITVDSQFLPDTRIPVITRGTFASASNESRFIVKFQNTKFRNIEGLMDWNGFMVQQGDSVVLAFDNVVHEWSVQGDFQRDQQAGIFICQDDGVTTIPSFNNYSYLTSRSSYVDIPNLISLDYGVRIADASFPGMSSIRVETVGTRDAGVNQWKISTGGYFYNVQVLYDHTRQIGRNPVNGELSATAIAGSMIVMNIGFGSAPRNAIIRLYRGTASGSYTHFVDIHTLGTTWLFDNGIAVNGIAWATRGAAAMNAINSMGSFIRFQGAHIRLESDALPNVAGSFTQGDLVDRIDTGIDGSSMVLFGHKRLTTGTGGVIGTDWANLRASHVSPAV